MNVPRLSLVPQQYVSMSSLDTCLFCSIQFNTLKTIECNISTSFCCFYFFNPQRLSAKSKDPRGFDISTTVFLTRSMTSYVLTLPWVNAEYTIKLEGTAENGAKYPPVHRPIRTMPYVHCKWWHLQ